MESKLALKQSDENQASNIHPENVYQSIANCHLNKCEYSVWNGSKTECESSNISIFHLAYSIWIILIRRVKREVFFT